MGDDELQELAGQIVGDGLVRAVMSGRRRGRRPRWRRVAVRPVVVRGRRRLQFVYFDDAKSFTKNLSVDAARAEVGDLVGSGFAAIHVETVAETIEAKITKKDKITVHRAPAARPAPMLEHDRVKKRLLPADASDPYLRAVGIATADGRIRASRYDKFRQINEFLRLLEETTDLDALGAPLEVVDLGCGHAYLTFATYHYLNNVRGIPTSLTGVDSNADAVARNSAAAERLGWEALRFHCERILDFEPAVPPQIVIALHACDTATDDALARAVRWSSELVLTSPCCHHHLNEQLRAGGAPGGFGLATRHGILRERVGDVLTDAFRAAILDLLGYRAQVVEFVSPEHTTRNLMLRAVRTGAPPQARRIREYLELRDSWKVTAYLEETLADEVKPLLA